MDAHTFLRELAEHTTKAETLINEAKAAATEINMTWATIAFFPNHLACLTPSQAYRFTGAMPGLSDMCVEAGRQLVDAAEAYHKLSDKITELSGNLASRPPGDSGT